MNDAPSPDATSTKAAVPAADGPVSTTAAVELVLMRRLGWTRGQLRVVAALVGAFILAALFALPQALRSDCDRLGDLIVSARDMSRNEADEHAGEFSDLLARCADSGDRLPDSYFTG